MKMGLLALAACFADPATTEANFGLFRRPATTTYYCPPPVWTTGYPVYFSVPTMVSSPVFPATPAQPLVPGTGYAVPQAAPPSSTPEPPPQSPRRPVTPMMPPASGATTSFKVGESFFDVYSGPARAESASLGENCSVAFWNLSGRPIMLRVDGREWDVPHGRTVTLELPRSFAWQVVGREAEATRIDNSHATAEVLIRR